MGPCIGGGRSSRLRARDQAALWFEEAGDVDLAVRLRSRLLDDVIRFAEGPEEVDHARYALARSMTLAERYQEALAMWRGLVADKLRTDGRFSTTSLEVRSKLAGCAGLAGDAQLAVSVLEEVVADASHFTTVWDWAWIRYARELAYWTGKAGDWREAVTRLRQLLETTTEHGGSDRQALSIRWMMADCMAEAGDVADGIRELEDVVALAEGATGPWSTVTRSARECLEKWRRCEAG